MKTILKALLLLALICCASAVTDCSADATVCNTAPDGSVCISSTNCGCNANSDCAHADATGGVCNTATNVCV